MRKPLLVGLLIVGTLLTPIRASAAPPRVPILLYHHIAYGYGLYFVSQWRLEQQLIYLSTNGYHSISLSNYLDTLEYGLALPDKPVILTFDDGYRDAYENAYPLLEKYHMVGTFFIITGQVGDPAYMTWDQIRSMQQAGMEIGSHTVHHAFLTRLWIVNAIAEMLQSRFDLQAHLKTPINFFAYPYNDHNWLLAWIARLVGYRAACIVTPFKNDPAGDSFLLPRLPMLPMEDMQSFALAVAE